MRPYSPYDTWPIPHWLRRFGPLKLVRAPMLDRRPLHYFMLYSSFNAIMWGAASLGAVVMRKTLGASEMQIGLVSAIGAITLLLGIFGSELVMGRDKRPFIFWVGLASRLTLLLYLVCYSSWTFIAITAIFSILHALLTPAIFGWWQANVTSQARSRLWGMIAMATTLVTMAAAYLTGLALHHDPQSFRWLFAVTGLIGAGGILLLVKAPLRGRYKLNETPVKISLEQVVVRPVRNFYRLMLRDRRFLYFEGAYFLYGCAIMLTFPVMPIYITDAAKMDYDQAGIALGIMSQLGIVFLSASWGRMMDLRGPILTSAWNFAILAMFPLVLLLGPVYAGLGVPLFWGVYLSHIIQGIGMAGVNVTWSLAPVVFAGDQDSSLYSGAHVTMTGIRGAVMPTLGALGLKYFGYPPVFIASSILFALAATGMILLARRYPGLHQRGGGSSESLQPANAQAGVLSAPRE